MRRFRIFVKWTAVLTGLTFCVPPGAISGQSVPDGGQPPESDRSLLRAGPAAHRVPLVITLDDAVQLALDGSFDIYRLTERYLQLAYGLEEARRSLRTRIYLDSLLPKRTQGYVNQLYTDLAHLDLVLFKQETTRVTAALNIVQPLKTNGNITLSTRMTGFERHMEALSPEFLFTSPKMGIRYVMPRISLDFNQPLFQYNTIKGHLREAELDLESLELSYNEVEIQRINEITFAFYSLYTRQRLLDISDQMFKQSEVNYQTGLRRYELGLIPEMEKLSLEVEMANSQDRLLRARHELDSQRVTFNRTVGIDPDFELVVDADETFRPIQIDLERALEMAFQNRSDERRAQIEVEKAELEIQKTISRNKPDLQFNIGIDYSANSTEAGSDRDDGWFDHLQAGLDPDYIKPNLNVFLSFRLPISDSRTNESRIQQIASEQRVLMRETEEVQFELHATVVEHVSAMQSAMQRMELQAQNRNLARAGYEISQEQFEKAEIRYTELLLAQQRYLQTETLFMDAMIDYEEGKARLREITMFDWETNTAVRRQTIPSVPFARGR